MTPEYDELIDTFICFRLYTYIILNIYVYIQFNVSKMDGYRPIELGQELRCVKEMGATLWCLSMLFTLHPPPVALAVGTLAADDSAGVFSSAGC